MLRLTKADFDALRAHGEQTYPHECCGVLLGTSDNQGNTVHQTVPAANSRTDSPHNRYHIAPHELIRIQRLARQMHLDIVGFYHSHPDHPAQWSSIDLAQAHWLGCSYVITAVEQAKAAATRSFLLSGSGEVDKRFEDEMIGIT
jgi:proteasome lid subunit RPN8/RPN11